MREAERRRAFQDLKEALTTAPPLSPYRLGRDNMVICDGSPESLAGTLFQKTTDGYKPVNYISRILSDTEKRYSQIEREATAGEFATRQLSMYLVGAVKFKLATDHKLLLPILNSANAKISPSSPV